jgi:hypothetical protein
MGQMYEFLTRCDVSKKQYVLHFLIIIKHLYTSYSLYPVLNFLQAKNNYYQKVFAMLVFQHILEKEKSYDFFLEFIIF